MTRGIKLPPIELPKFSGGTIQWLEFYGLFEAIIHQNPELSKIVKFTYLNSQLTGEPKELLKWLSITSANYNTALDILKEEYGDSQAAIDIHYVKLMEIPRARNVIELKQINFEIEVHFRSLEALEQNIDHRIFVTILKSKIPVNILAKLNFQRDNEPWTVEALRNAIKRYLKAYKEVIENSTEPKKPVPEITGLSTNYENMNKDRKLNCTYCDNKHFSDQCTLFPTLLERSKFTEGACCMICLGKNHSSQSCHSMRTCYHCKAAGQHHRSLCPTKFGTTKKSSTEQNLQPNTTNSDLESHHHHEQPEPRTKLACENTVNMVTDADESTGAAKSPVIHAIQHKAKDSQVHEHSTVGYPRYSMPVENSDFVYTVHKGIGMTNHKIPKFVLALSLIISIQLCQLISNDGITVRFLVITDNFRGVSIIFCLTLVSLNSFEIPSNEIVSNLFRAECRDRTCIRSRARSPV